MDFSKHVRNGITTYYAYYEYELLDDAQREANKGELQCYGCSAPTKFVKASKSGSQAYFGLMPGEVQGKIIYTWLCLVEQRLSRLPVNPIPFPEYIFLQNVLIYYYNPRSV